MWLWFLGFLAEVKGSRWRLGPSPPGPEGSMLEVQSQASPALHTCGTGSPVCLPLSRPVGGV